MAWQAFGVEDQAPEADPTHRQGNQGARASVGRPQTMTEFIDLRNAKPKNAQEWLAITSVLSQKDLWLLMAMVVGTVGARAHKDQHAELEAACSYFLEDMHHLVGTPGHESAYRHSGDRH